MQRTIIRLFVVGFILSGCQTGGVGMVGSPLWQVTATSEDKLRVFTNACLSYGFQRGTPEMAQCVQNESNGAKSSASRSLNNFNQNNTNMLNQNRVLNTTCRSYGVNTRCTTM
jgi:hypothetical protein